MHHSTDAVIIIPARLASTRLPRKMLLRETGKPLIQHTYENAQKSCAASVIVATDSEEIRQVVESFGGKAVMTSSSHQSGTQRIAQAAEEVLPGNFDGVIVNLQGDEPTLNPASISFLIHAHARDKPFMSTLFSRFKSHARSGAGSPLDPATVKVVVGASASASSVCEATARPRQALYFSRSLIPYAPLHTQQVMNPEDYFLHIGVYAFSLPSLREFVSLPHGALERREGLEQLRALENGHNISAYEIESVSGGIDTFEDYEAFLVEQVVRHE